MGFLVGEAVIDEMKCFKEFPLEHLIPELGVWCAKVVLRAENLKESVCPGLRANCACE